MLRLCKFTEWSVPVVIILAARRIQAYTRSIVRKLIDLLSMRL